MDPVSLTVGTSWTLAGVVCIATAVPLMQGRIGRNPYYGVRFPQSYSSDEAWFAINRYGSRRMILWAVPQIVTGIATFFLPLQNRTALTLTLGIAPLLFIFLPLLETWRFARRYQPAK